MASQQPRNPQQGYFEDLETGQDVKAVAVAVLEDLDDERLGEAEVEPLRLERAVSAAILASASVSLWVFKMLKIRSKRRVLWDLNHCLKQRAMSLAFKL
ncbi:hypothetical protein Dsin_012882 [Dipteronia sinensis]|uniref:Uncharacterized protein n=1 Tax=Dipteronia sinensis TaxID=43782 RepID=A0AAE0AIY3_9ROSI|nr:hypothetical protein Dsin_012882 [Dipteronia sinensis]